MTRHAACSVLTVRTPRAKTHEAFAQKSAAGIEAPFLLRAHLAKEGVGVRLDLAKKDALFSHVATAFERVLEGITAKEIADALWDRERSQNTAVGRGIAIPHATLPQLKSSTVGIFTTAAPIDYQAPDGTLVDVFFVTLGPPSERQTHLGILSGVARLALRTGLMDRLRSATDVATALRAVEEADASVSG